MSDIPSCGPEGWGLCGHPGAQGEPWGARRDMGDTYGSTGLIAEVKHSVVSMKLMKGWILELFG